MDAVAGMQKAGTMMKPYRTSKGLLTYAAKTSDRQGATVFISWNILPTANLV